MTQRVAARAPLAAAIVAAVALAGPLAAAEFDNPDWPCIQRMVPSLSIGQMWSGPPPDGDWRDDPEVRSLAAAIAPRRSTLEDVGTAVAAFAADLPEKTRPDTLALLFSGVLSLIDAERAQLIAGIGRYARNQTALSARVEAVQGELVTLSAAEVKDLDRIEELEDTLAWEIRIFRERAQSLSYVCETPILLEQRAFAIARLIAAEL